MMQNLFKLAMMQKNFAWNQTLSLKKVNSLKGIVRVMLNGVRLTAKIAFDRY